MMDESVLIKPFTPEDRRERVLKKALLMQKVTMERGKNYEFSLSDFDIGKPLGRGKFGRVYLARDRKTHFIVAIKTLMKEEIKKSHMHHQVVREIEIQSRLKHDNVLDLYTFFHDEKRIYLVLEYAAKGELFSELHRQPHSRFPEERAAKYVYQVAEALQYCHSRKVIHRDIKPENILLDIFDNIKLADFGWSVHAPSNRRKTMCGTVDYLPPEIVNRSYYDDRIDNWCLGILTFELLCGHPPFESSDTEATYRKIRDVEINFPKNFSIGSIDLIKDLVQLLPEKRLSLEEVKSHYWLVANYKSTLPVGSLQS